MDPNFNVRAKGESLANANVNANGQLSQKIDNKSESNIGTSEMFVQL